MQLPRSQKLPRRAIPNLRIGVFAVSLANMAYRADPQLAYRYAITCNPKAMKLVMHRACCFSAGGVIFGLPPILSDERKVDASASLTTNSADSEIFQGYIAAELASHPILRAHAGHAARQSIPRCGHGRRSACRAVHRAFPRVPVPLATGHNAPRPCRRTTAPQGAPHAHRASSPGDLARGPWQGIVSLIGFVWRKAFSRPLPSFPLLSPGRALCLCVQNHCL
jgi:hypothetical protein